ncbi:MAG: DKNYY domain-containing protein [Parcubacteria group bacterium]
MNNKNIPTIFGTITIVIIAVTVGVFIWKYEKIKNNSQNIENIAVTNNTDTASPSKKEGARRQLLQTYANEKYAYGIQYQPGLIVSENSSDENIILSDNDSSHWKIQISVSNNSDGSSLEKIFDQRIESLNIPKENLIIADMHIDGRRAKKYLIKNYSDYGNSEIIFLDKNNIFTIYGNSSIEEINTIFITRLWFLTGEKSQIDRRTTPYFIDYSGVYFVEYFNTLKKLENVDVKTFKTIGVCASMEMSASYYSRDKNNIYVNSKKMEGVDIKSFKYLGAFLNGDGMPYSVSISMDKKHVYFACGTLVDFIDRDSFEILGNSYSRDKKRVYYLDHTLDRADRKTFEVIQYKEKDGIYGHFALDKNHVFFEGAILKDINPTTCKAQGLASCLPSKWHDLLDPLSTGTKFNDGIY